MSGGVFDHGAHEEDGPVTREVLASPRRKPVLRRAGDPSPTRRAPNRGVRGRPQNKLLHRGRSPTRGTEVAANGGEEVGGLHTSFDAGELAGDSDPAEPRRPVWMRTSGGTHV